MNENPYLQVSCGKSAHMLQEALASIHADGYSHEAALKLLGTIARRDKFDPVLRDIIANPARVYHVAAQSYWHDNGFLKVVLGVGPNGSKIRLHVWLPGARIRQPTENIHNHRWPFATTLLSGRYCTTEFVQTARDSGRQCFRYEYLPGGSSAQYTLCYRSSERLTIRRRYILRAGEFDCVAPTIYHQVRPAYDGIVASLICQGPVVEQSVDVFCQKYRGKHLTLGSSPIKPDDLRCVLQQVRNILGKGATS